MIAVFDDMAALVEQDFAVDQRLDGGIRGHKRVKIGDCGLNPGIVEGQLHDADIRVGESVSGSQNCQ